MGIQEQVKELTGTETRLVWTQLQEGCTDFVGITDKFKLMGFDTEEGERELAGTVDSYVSPRITPQGDQVVYTSNKDHTVKVINWDGSGKRTLKPGYALCVWQDPATGTQWVYVRPNNTDSWFSKSKPVTRFKLDDPDTEETVWTKKSISWEWFQLSPDGTCAAVCMFWPTCGLINLQTEAFTKFDKGCWTSMCPDHSHRMWVFDGNHREVKLYDAQGTKLGTLDLHGGPGVNNWEIYHPKWGNHPRFVTVTGPFSNNQDHTCDRNHEADAQNFIPQGGYNVELYLGRLNKALTEVEAWVRITENAKPDFFGDVWVKP